MSRMVLAGAASLVLHTWAVHVHAQMCEPDEAGFWLPSTPALSVELLSEHTFFRCDGTSARALLALAEGEQLVFFDERSLVAVVIGLDRRSRVLRLDPSGGVATVACQLGDVEPHGAFVDLLGTGVVIVQWSAGSFAHELVVCNRGVSVLELSADTVSIDPTSQFVAVFSSSAAPGVVLVPRVFRVADGETIWSAATAERVLHTSWVRRRGVTRLSVQFSRRTEVVVCR